MEKIVCPPQWKEAEHVFRALLGRYLIAILTEDAGVNDNIDWTLGYVNDWFTLIDDQGHQIAIAGDEDKKDILSLSIEYKNSADGASVLDENGWGALLPHLPFRETIVGSVDLLFGMLVMLGEVESLLEIEMKSRLGVDSLPGKEVYQELYQHTLPLEAVVLHFMDGQSIAFVNSYVQLPTTVDMFFNQEMIRDLYSAYKYRVAIS